MYSSPSEEKKMTKLSPILTLAVLCQVNYSLAGATCEDINSSFPDIDERMSMCMGHQDICKFEGDSCMSVYENVCMEINATAPNGKVKSRRCREADGCAWVKPDCVERAPLPDPDLFDTVCEELDNSNMKGTVKSLLCKKEKGCSWVKPNCIERTPRPTGAPTEEPDAPWYDNVCQELDESGLKGTTKSRLCREEKECAWVKPNCVFKTPAPTGAPTEEPESPIFDNVCQELDESGLKGTTKSRLCREEKECAWVKPNCVFRTQEPTGAPTGAPIGAPTGAPTGAPNGDLDA